MPEVTVDGHTITLSNLEKEYWPGSYVKADLIRYYAEVGSFALPYLQGRPVVMSRYPDGIGGKNFYQKNSPEHAPDWMRTVRVMHSEKEVNYLVYENRATLVWLANQGCIEMHSTKVSQLVIHSRPLFQCCGWIVLAGVAYRETLEKSMS